MNTIPETYKTLELQVEALREGTNPIVFFPEGTRVIPKLPTNMRSVNIHRVGSFYYNPKFLQEPLIKRMIYEGKMWALLGFVQDKAEVAKGFPIIITVRDLNGNEIKSAAVDSNNNDLVALQAYIFHQFFPNRIVEATTVFHIVAERLGGTQDA